MPSPTPIPIPTPSNAAITAAFVFIALVAAAIMLGSSINAFKCSGLFISIPSCCNTSSVANDNSVIKAPGNATPPAITAERPAGAAKPANKLVTNVGKE